MSLIINNASSKQRVYNETYPSRKEKQTVIDPCERSFYQLLEQYSVTEQGNSSAYRMIKKAHATLFKKRFSPMYLEHLVFVINRGGWCVTKMYSHFTFELEAVKKNFILMNQKSRQNAKNYIEKGFFKLMNNSNFGYDCRNNLDNCQFIPIFDELKEVTYLKSYYN